MKTRPNNNFTCNNGLVAAYPVRAISAIAAILVVLAAAFAYMELCVGLCLHAKENQF
jgi:hypothetical protein